MMIDPDDLIGKPESKAEEMVTRQKPEPTYSWLDSFAITGPLFLVAVIVLSAVVIRSLDKLSSSLSEKKGTQKEKSGLVFPVPLSRDMERVKTN